MCLFEGLISAELNVKVFFIVIKLVWVNTNVLIWLIFVFNATFSNISAISWRPVLVVEEAGENHRP